LAGARRRTHVSTDKTKPRRVAAGGLVGDMDGGMAEDMGGLPMPRAGLVALHAVDKTNPTSWVRYLL